VTENVIVNIWTGTVHTNEACRGLIESRAPREHFTREEADAMTGLRPCGYCFKSSRPPDASRAPERKRSRRPRIAHPE
jgi:hypothetical protein